MGSGTGGGPTAVGRGPVVAVGCRGSGGESSSLLLAMASVAKRP